MSEVLVEAAKRKGEAWPRSHGSGGGRKLVGIGAAVLLSASCPSGGWRRRSAWTARGSRLAKTPLSSEATVEAAW